MIFTMARAIIDRDKCKGCGLCTTACPKKILELCDDVINSKGYKPATLTDEAACIGCAMCAVMCPHVAIVVEK